MHYSPLSEQPMLETFNERQEEFLNEIETYLIRAPKSGAGA